MELWWLWWPKTLLVEQETWFGMVEEQKGLSLWETESGVGIQGGVTPQSSILCFLGVKPGWFRIPKGESSL